jgi:hypothetical protein
MPPGTAIRVWQLEVILWVVARGLCTRWPNSAADYAVSRLKRATPRPTLADRQATRHLMMVGLGGSLLRIWNVRSSRASRRLVP